MLLRNTQGALRSALVYVLAVAASTALAQWGAGLPNGANCVNNAQCWSGNCWNWVCTNNNWNSWNSPFFWNPLFLPDWAIGLIIFFSILILLCCCGACIFAAVRSSKQKKSTTNSTTAYYPAPPQVVAAAPPAPVYVQKEPVYVQKEPVYRPSMEQPSSGYYTYTRPSYDFV